MPSGTGAWGSGGWGDGSWGGGVGLGSFTLVAIEAYRENVFRLEFSQPVYFSNVLDFEDASVSSKYTITEVAGSVGLDGNPVRPIVVIEVLRPGTASGVAQADLGRFIDLVTDRPMTPHPALYDIAIEGLYSSDLLSGLASDTEARAQAVFKLVAHPTMDVGHPSRDIANPTTRSAMADSLPDPNNPLNLGTIVVDDTGDYAFDEGLVNLKKRVIRRLITKKGAFAHLPNYGVGVLEYGKKLAIPAIVADVAGDAEIQIALEPDVAKVKVRPIIDPNTPGLVRFQVLVRARSGPTQRFDIPFQTA